MNAFTAVAGAVGLVTGALDLGDGVDDRLPFDSLALAGLALAVVVGIPLALVAWSAWTGGPRTDDLAFVAGVMLIGWIVVQVALIRAFSLFQPLYLAVGASFVGASHRLSIDRRHGGMMLVVTGAPLTAVGVGLLPHLIERGLGVVSAVAAILLAAGLAVVVVGAAAALRGRTPLGTVAGGVAALTLLVAAVSIVAPAVAATSVPPTDISSTPATLGLEYESVTLTTPDAVELAAWYLAGTNGAGVVVMHGAGSTRSDVLDQTAALARRGYSVVTIDARGHGDSDGTAMDFGWYGDLDIAAGTAFLAARTEVDSDRIGVVGFSMGGEEAIGAAATDPLIRAVVAEGATARQAADKAWLSDVYGWRGWVQEQIDHMQDVVTGYLTDAGTPTSLRSSVEAAVDTRFLLITAGNVADEGHAASYIRSGSDRVEVWSVDGADHTAGHETRPEFWEQRVVAFLDASLRTVGARQAFRRSPASGPARR